MADENGPVESIFDPRVVNQATLLTLLQIKDYLAVIAANLDDETTTRVEELHDLGQFLCPVAVPADSGE